MKKRRSKSFYATWVACVLTLVVLVLAYLSSGPDLDLALTREVPSELDAQTLGQAIEVVRNWPKWFYSLESAQVIDIAGRPYSGADQKIQKGSVVKLSFDPQRGPWRKFEVLVNVREYVPNQKLEMQVVSDSNHKLSHLFDRLDWEVEILPSGGHTLVRGTARAHTALWRSRLFGRLFQKILMNQVYYPDIIHLALLENLNRQILFRNPKIRAYSKSL